MEAISILYATSGDEFYVDLPFDEALDLVLSDSTSPVAVTAVRWTNVDGPSFDEHSDDPVYTEARLAVRPHEIFGAEEYAPHAVAIVNKAREYEADRRVS